MSLRTASKSHLQLNTQGAVQLKAASGAQATLSQQGDVALQASGGAKVHCGADGSVQLCSVAGCKAVLSDKVVLKDPAGQSITLQAGKVTIQSSATVELSAPSVKLAAGTLQLGQGAALHPALAEKLALLFNTHTHTTSMGPSGPPLVPMTPAAIGSNTVTLAN